MELNVSVCLPPLVKERAIDVLKVTCRTDLLKLPKLSPPKTYWACAVLRKYGNDEAGGGGDDNDPPTWLVLLRKLHAKTSWVRLAPSLSAI